jgi:hypothetical protein
MNILLLLFIIMAVNCPSCKREFKNNQGLTKHRNTCKGVLPDISRLLQRHDEQLEHKRAVKRARREAVNDVAEEEIVPDVESNNAGPVCLFP